MAKGFYTLDLGAGRVPFYGTHTGGHTLQLSMEVYKSDKPATKIDYGSGAEEYKPLELELQDYPQEGLYLDDILAEFVAWNADKDDLRTAIVQHWKDADFTEERSKWTLTKGWCKEFTPPDGDRKANEVRTMTAMITHQGSTFELGAA